MTPKTPEMPPAVPPPPPEAVSSLMLGTASRSVNDRRINAGREQLRTSLGTKKAIGMAGARSASRGNQRIKHTYRTASEAANANGTNKTLDRVDISGGGLIKEAYRKVDEARRNS